MFDHLGVDEGLTNSTVTSICQDSRGFMWFGTFHGLNRFDGYQVSPYLANPADSLALSSNVVTCLFEDSRHTLWVGTRLGGLNRYDRRRDCFVHYTAESRPPYQLSANRIECIFEDSGGNLWVGTNRGLNLLERGSRTFRAFYQQAGTPGTLNSNEVYGVIENDRHQVLVLTNERLLNRYDPRTQRFAPLALGTVPPGTQRMTRLLAQDRAGRYWLGTLGDGLLRTGAPSLRQYLPQPRRPGSLSHRQVRALLQTRQGELWVGTDGGGLDVYDPEHDSFTAIRAREERRGSLSSDAIYSLYQDWAGTIWVGTFGGGVCYYSPYKTKFAYYPHLPGVANSLGHRSVLALCQDAWGSIWVGTDGGGLDVFDPVRQTFRHFRHDPHDPHSLAADIVKAVYEDRQGELWVGTYLGGLDRYDRAHQRFVHYANEPGNPRSLASNIGWALYEDRRNQLWVSTLGSGVCRLDRTTNAFTRFQPLAGPGALNDYNVVTMLEDAGGQLWLGTEDNGLDLYHPASNSFSYLRHVANQPSSLSSNRVQVLFNDSHGQLWVGTADGGLNLLDAKTQTFRHFTTAQGLPSNVVNAIVEDRAGYLWLSTNKGLARFDPRRHTVKSFDREDGLQSNEFNINSATRGRNSNLYFGGINGLNVFSPTVLLQNPHLPPVVLTDVQVLNASLRPGAAGSSLTQQISETSNLTLPYRAAAVTFQFAALNYLDPHKSQYAYQLVGFDDAWRFCGTRREATYTNLDPGRYVFQVKAANNDGLWSAQATSLTLIITPPWWKTTWFRTLAALAVGGGGAAFYLLRTRALRQRLQLEKLQALRTKEAELREARLTHEKTLVELSKNQLETEVLHKNSELASSVMSMVHQNETLLGIRDRVREALDDADAQQQRRKMQRVVRLIDKNLEPTQHWEHFEALFDQLHHNFMQHLKEQYPQLTSRDLKLCAYLRMNLDSKEIASLMGLSVRGAEDLRYRVRKKMQLDTTTNLSEFILLL
ncbi:MAG: two-component regulator propeller domain-containing protein [Janthinobacterium lividum]